MHCQNLTIIFGLVTVTFLLGLALRQLTYALLKGSVFEPLRQMARRGKDEGRPHYDILSDILECELCTTMQLSIWTIALPGGVGLILGGLPALLANNMAWYGSWALSFVIATLYAFAVSGIALWLFNLIEYPFARYQEAVKELMEAKRQIADLQATASPEKSTVSIVPSLEELRVIIEKANTQCGSISCVFRREDCRQNVIADQLNHWAGDNLNRRRELVRLRAACEDHLPRYFFDHDHPSQNWKRESLKEIHEKIVTAW